MTKRFIISEEEKSDIRAKYGLVNEQMNRQQSVDIQMRTIKPEMGGKYCFGDPKRVQSTYGDNVKLYKVKSGDTLSGIAAKYHGISSVDEIIATNRSCNLSQGLKGGDVIAITILPSM
jgi:nucleoid-associated protein YgaU